MQLKKNYMATVAEKSMPKRLSLENYLRIRKNILKNLYSNHTFSKGHLLFERLQNTVPTHLQGFTKYVLKGLLKEEIILFYGKTRYGNAYQLNIKKLKEIEEIVGVP